MKFILTCAGIAATVLLGGCEANQVQPDQCLRQEIFKQCMSAIPQGPTHLTDTDNWGKVIDKCENAAYYQSKRQITQIKPECRAY